MAYESESLQIGGDPNDDQSSANLVAMGDWMRGQLAAPDDVDFFKFTVSAPGRLILNFDGADPKRSATSWKIDVLDANLDFVRTLVPSVAGNLTASVTADSRTITVSGLTTAVKAGDRFTTVTVNEADSQIYTVVEATTLRGGSQTLTLDTNWTARTDTSIAFDPAQMLANGAVSSLNANISQAGTYYLKVTAAAFTDSTYALQLGFDSALEADLNNTKEQAVTENSRLVPDLSQQGRVSPSDPDVWLLSTASGGTFKIDFAAGSADAGTPFNLKVESWTRSNGLDVLTGVTSRGQAVSGAVTGTKSIEIDNAANPGATTFVVTVTTSALSGSAQGAYTLKASGSELDINDQPLIQVGSYTSGRPDDVLDLITDDLFSVAVAAEKKVALSSFLSASDADGQPLTYQFFLDALGDSVASGDIVIEQADGSWVTYVDGAVMSAAELAKAYVRAGSAVGNLVLNAQAFDNSGRPDNSGASGLVQLKIRVVSGTADVVVAHDDLLQLTEGAVAGDQFQEPVTFKLTEAPAAGETVTLRLVDAQNQLILDKRVLTFTSEDFDAPQTVNVRALSDGKVEGAQTVNLQFTVTSDSANSSYAGLQLAPLVFALTDPINTAASGTVQLSSASTQGEVLTANAAGIADADGLGTFNYVWQRSLDDGANWDEIAGETAQTYTLAQADVGAKVRAVVRFTDGQGNLETIASSATATVLSDGSGAGVTITHAENLLLTEGASSGAAGYQQLLRFQLDEAPGVDETVTLNLELLDTTMQLLLDKTTLTFNRANFADEQVVQVRALKDGRLEGSHTATLGFRLASSAPGSPYATLQLDPLSLALTEPANTVVSGTVQLSSASTQGEVVSADATGIVDADGLGTFNYVWQRSLDGGDNWDEITGATEQAYTLAREDVGAKVRAVVRFTDGQGNLETISSSATPTVVFPNTAPDSADADVLVLPKAAFEYRFKLSDFPFDDVDSGDQLASVKLIDLPANSLLSYDGNPIAATEVFSIPRADLSKLSLTVPQGVSVGDTLATLRFQVVDSLGGISAPQVMTLLAGAPERTVHLVPSSGFEAQAFQFGVNAQPTALSARMFSPVGLDMVLALASAQTSTTVNLQVDSSLNATGYWVQDPAGFWVNLATEVSTDVNGLTTLKVQIEDGRYDSDDAAGQVEQSGVIADMPLSVVGITPDATDDGYWF